MSPAQDLHDRVKALADEFRGTPGLTFHLAQLDGFAGHLRQTIKQQANVLSAAPVAVETPAAPEAPAATVAPLSPPAKPAPVVQVARPAAK